MFRKILLAALFCSLAVAQDAKAPLRPILKLEKPKYVLGESILFEVGMEPATADGKIPSDIVTARKPCALNISRPDGSHETQSVNWPVDGDLSGGFIGGWGLPAAMAGDYMLVLECSGVVTAPVKLPVIKNSISKQIKIALEFKKGGTLHRSGSLPFTFDLRNDSPYYIQFPERGAIIGDARKGRTMVDGVALHIVRRDPAATWDVIYPWKELSDKPRAEGLPSNDRLPTITLVPGGHFEQNLYVEDAFKLDEPGQYEITISTSVTVFARESDGKLKDFSPVRLSAKRTGEFTVTDSLY